MKKRVQKEENNTKFGNAFHKKVEKLFMDLGMEIKYSSFTGEGPDIIASDPRTKTKFVIQCKATRKPKLYPGLKALINEYAERRRDARADISIIALSGYKISEKINLDEVSKKKKVRFITDETISEYIQLVSKINSFAIYQILADLGVAKKFDKESFFAPALHIKHPGHQFFVAAPTVEWLLKSASVYRRGGPSLHVKGYQRILNRDRVLRQIPEYLSQNEWVFPNAIICATQDNRSSKIKLSKKGEISLPSTTGLLWVIDGQHRLYSFANAPKELLKQKLLTVFFDSSLMKDKAESIQADIFIKLNKNAQRVKPTLVLELLKDLLTTKDIRLQVAFKLCDSSVLGDLVKTYTKKGGQIDLVTLSTTQPIVQLTNIDGPILNNKKITPEVAVAKISSYIEAYFKIVRKVYKKEWGNSDYIISDNRGIRALLRILVHLINENKSANREKVLKITEKSLRSLKSKINTDSDAYRSQYLGEGGANSLAKEWIEAFSGISSGQIPKSENNVTEFKSTLRWDINRNQINKDLPQEITRAVCAFQNSRGGTVYIGVDDDGKLLGLRKDLELCAGRGNPEDKFSRLITQVLREDLGATAAGKVKYQLLEKNGEQYAEISTMPSNKPVYIKRTKFYVRHGAESVQLEGEEMQKYITEHFSH